jgi:chemotaxis protein MotA
VRTSTGLGVLLGIAFLSLAVWASGGDGSIFTHRPALLLVLGGTFAAAILASSRQTALHALSALSRLFVTRSLSTRQVAVALVDLARKARTTGLATIDLEAAAIGDPFLAKGLELLVDGVEPERIEALLRLESELLSARRAQAERLFRLMALTAPLLGVAGTLIELRLWPLGPTGPGPAVIGPLAAACYGLLLSGLLFLPLAGKVRTLDRHERLVRDQVVAGLIAVRLGQNPEFVRETMAAFGRKKG